MTTVVEGFKCPLHVYEIVLDELALLEETIMEVMDDTTNVYYQDVHI